jgi:hypothetical protein
MGLVLSTETDIQLNEDIKLFLKELKLGVFIVLNAENVHRTGIIL